MGRLTILFILMLLLLSGAGAQAANRAWTGGGADNNWNTANNWGGTAPIANDLLFFAGITRLTNTNNIAASTAFNGITFSNYAGAFTLRGNAINLAGGVTNNCATNTEIISLNLALTASRTVSVASGGTLSIGGIVSGSTFGITKVGAGTLTLSNANTFSGAATILGGTLSIQKDGGLGSVTSVNVGTGTILALGSGASNNYINGAATVGLTNTAVLNLAFTGSDSVSNLYINGVHKLSGTWGATGSGATYIDNTHFQGSGVLNVVSGPTSGTSVSGSPNPATWGQSITLTAIVTGTNGVPPLTGTVTFKDGAIVLGTGTLNGTPAATATFTTNRLAVGSHAITAIYSGDTNFAGSTSANYTQTVNPGPFAKLQLLVPGETAAPGTTTGKTGTPATQLAGRAFSVTVNAVDANWNPISTNDTVTLTSSDTSATMPANTALLGGTKSFSIALGLAGSSTLTASNVTHTAIAANTSSAITVYGVAPAAQSRPLVAIHDSELTRALETLPATGATPSGSGTTGYQWWPTNWHYFVMPDSVKEALRSDGTAFEVVGDLDISSGSLLAANGQPRCPILISLASEAIRDDEIAQLTNYVAAGGTLLIGSSAFTRNTDGTSRGDFALADQMGVHMVAAGLTNWGANNNFTKTANHLLTSHIPSGALTWRMPSAAEEIPWGISPAHPYLAPHAAWQVQASNATVLAQGDNYPYLVTKPFGKGQFIYLAPMQPLIGFSGFAPSMYSYVIFRKAIEWAFASAKLPVPKLSPWPFAYDAAFLARRDLENYTNEVAGIAASAQIDYTNGVTGDYYFCTGTLREDAASAYNTNTLIAGLRQAVTNYGAGIYPHNGGLKNPNNPALVRGQYDYWHWGPDEALDTTPTNYPSGKIYALASISNSFHDVEGWLTGLTNGLRGWCSCYFNGTREDSYDIQAQLGVDMAGDQKLTPFPNWTLSTRTPDKRYAFLSQPVSDWFVNGLVAQSLEPWHPPGVQTSQTLHSAVDYYYSLGALINFYSHTLSTGLGDAGSLQLDYITYGLNTNLHPRLWSANAVKVYQWWLTRSNAQVIPSYATNGNQAIATLSIQGASDPRTAVEILVPQPNFYGLQVFTNGTHASGNSYRINGQVVKVLAGASVTNAEIRYNFAPVAVNDLYYMTQGSPFTNPAPGVLSNDLSALSGPLTAKLLSGPAHGTLIFNSDGSFSYAPAAGFSGVDSFSYQASDAVTNSGVAIVTLCVTPSGDLFADDFTRSGTADPWAPWQVVSGAWAMTNGMLQATGALQTYSFACVSNTWTDYWVQGRVQFPTGAFGGGLGGRLNPVSGAHYAAWVYPQGGSGGSSVLKLIKFQNWSGFGYTNTSYAPMQQVGLTSVGTNWHTLKLAFQGSQIAVYFDGSQVMSVPDIEPQPYTSGGISLDMWTDTAAYTMSADNIVAGPLVMPNNYSATENLMLTIPAPGLLTNDTEVYGTSLSAAVVSGPTNGTLNLNSNGGFSYWPATNFAGTDSFVYQANDGPNSLGTALVNITVIPVLIATADNLSRNYGAANPTLTGSLVGLQNGDNISASFTTVASTNSPVGAYPIIVSLSDPGYRLTNYIVVTNTGTLLVTPAALTVTASNQSKVYGTADPTLTGSVAGVQNGDGITATYATPATTGSSVGTYPITPTLVDPGGKLTNYSVSSSNGTLGITWATLTVMANPQTRTYGAANPTLTAVMTGFVNGDTQASAVGGTPSISTIATASSDVGPYPIVPALGSLTATNYSFSFVNGTLNVTPASLTGTADAKSRLYGATNPPFTVTYTGFVSSQNASVVTGTLSGSTTATTNSPVGSYPISVSGQSATNYTLNYVDGTLTVAAAPLLVTGDNASRAYGQTNPAFSATITGWVIGEGTNVLGGALALSSPAQTNSAVGSYPIIPSGLASTNYAITFSNGTLNVTAYQLSVTAHSQSRAYGATNPVFSGTLTGVQNGDNITATYATTATTNSPVGSYAISPTLVDPNGKLTNYTVTSTNGTLSVTAAGLTVTANNASRVYGATNPVFSGTLTGVQNGDNITASYASTATVTSTVGTYPITPSLADPSGKLSNYSVSTTNGTLNVTAAGLTVAANNASRAYGATNPIFTGTLTGVQNGDNITASYASPATATSTVGSYPITPTLADPSGKLSNYSVSSTNGTLSVTTASLAVTAHNTPRAYGTTNPTLTGTITGLENGDNITAVYATTADTNSPVGSYPITPTLADPSGKISNYAISTTNGTLSVTTASLVVTAHNASRAYGTTNPALTGTITGLENGDNITAVYATAADTNSPVGSYPITPTLADPSGKISNYAISTTNGTLSVTAASLAVTAHNASRAYGTTNPAFTGTITGLENGDNITAVYATAADTNSPVGAYPITSTLADHSGKLSNYTVSSTNGTLQVTPATLTGTADAKSRLYGATNPPFTVTYTGFVNSQNASVVIGTLSGSTPATTNSPVGSYPISISGQSAPNYTIQYVDGILTVGAAPLLVTGDNASRAYGQTNPPFSATISGWVNGEDTNVLGGTLALTSPAQTNSPVGSYPIIPSGLTSTNYALSFSNGTLSVTAYALSVTANNASRAYGTTNPVFTGTLTGVQNGDNITAVYATAADTNSPVGTYPITLSLLDPGHNLANYSVTTNNGTLSVNPAPLTVTADPQTKLYGQPDPALTYRITSGGLVNGDNLSGALSRVAGENVAAYAILQGTLAASTNYALTYSGTNLTIQPHWLFVQAYGQSRMYGVTNPVLTIYYVGFVGTDGVTNLTEVPQASTLAQPNSPVGDYEITMMGGSASNYTLIPSTGTLTVTAAELTVAANNTSRAYGATNPVFTGTLTGVQNGDNITASYACTAMEISPAGNYPITPALLDPGSKLGNYHVILNDGILTVTAPRAPTILSILPISITNTVITWTSVSNGVYRVQYTVELTSTNWVDLAPDVTATGSTASFTDQSADAAQRYYRVSLLP